MKQKRTFIAVLLVIAVLALGVAFAAATTPLSISGQAAATASSANFKVAFTNGVAVTDEASEEDNQTIAVADIVKEGTAASFKVTGMSTEGDTATVTFTVTNNSNDLAAELSNLTVADTSGSDKFNCTATFAEGAKTTLQPGDSADIVVTVVLNETVVEDVASAEVITVNFTATAAVAE